MILFIKIILDTMCMQLHANEYITATEQSGQHGRIWRTNTVYPALTHPDLVLVIVTLDVLFIILQCGQGLRSFTSVTSLTPCKSYAKCLSHDSLVFLCGYFMASGLSHLITKISIFIVIFNFCYHVIRMKLSAMFCSS